MWKDTAEVTEQIAAAKKARSRSLGPSERRSVSMTDDEGDDDDTDQERVSDIGPAVTAKFPDGSQVPYVSRENLTVSDIRYDSNKEKTEVVFKPVGTLRERLYIPKQSSREVSNLKILKLEPCQEQKIPSTALAVVSRLNEPLAYPKT